MSTLSALALVSGCFVEPTGPVASPNGDSAIVALDIVPAGAYGPPSWADVGREARMYDSLTPKGATVSAADIAAGFKTAGLGAVATDGVNEVERPRAGLEVLRDGFNVPHITADTDEKAVWGVGWVSAGHAPLVYEVARRNGRLAAAGTVGVSAVTTALEQRPLEPSAAADALLARQVGLLAAGGAEEHSLLADIDAFVAGYNARLDAMWSILPRWTRLDIIALSAFKAEWWGRGGIRLLGTAPSDPFEPTVQDAPPVTSLPVPSRYHSAKASNFALISGERSDTGHPLLIGGPQVGFMYPGIAFEVDINSPGIDMRGLTAPAYPGYVFVGRGADFAWTINVAFDAETGVRIPVPLCADGDSYRVGQECEPFVRASLGSLYNLGDLLAPSTDVPLVTTRFGPVDTIDFVAGVAFVVERPGVGHDIDDLLAFRAVNHGEARGPEAFRAAMQRSPQAFNVGYVDADHIQAFRTCWCVRPGVGATPVAQWPSLVVPPRDLPATLDPPGGVVTNWNEPMTTTADGDWVPPGLGQFRHDWFEAFDRVPRHSVTTLVGSMNGQATNSSFGQVSFQDLVPQIEGARPPAIEWTNRSTAIQMVMSFGEPPATR